MPTKYLSRATLFFCLLFISVENSLAQFEEYGLKGKFYDGRFLVYASTYKIAEEVGAKARSIFQKVIDDVGYSGVYKTKFQILIWEKKESFEEFLKNSEIKNNPDTEAVALYALKGLPTIAGYLSRELLKKHLPHEFTHLVLAQLLDVSGEQIPLWLNEGLASYEGGASKEHLRFFLNSSIRANSYIKLRELFALKKYPEDKTQRELFYAEAQSFVSFLLKKRPRKEVFFSFLQWCVVKEYPFEKAYLYSYGESITPETIEKEWIEYINANHR